MSGFLCLRHVMCVCVYVRVESRVKFCMKCLLAFFFFFFLPLPFLLEPYVEPDSVVCVLHNKGVFIENTHTLLYTLGHIYLAFRGEALLVLTWSL